MRNLRLSLLLLSLCSLRAEAFIDLSSGEFTAQVVDFEMATNGEIFKLYRFYNHKAEMQGMFGNRWCANIEQELREEKEGYVSYSCGFQTPLYFKENTKVKLKNGDKSYSWQNETLIKFGKKKGFIRYSPVSGVLTYNTDGQLIGMRTSGAKSPWLRIVYNGKNKLIKRLVFGDTNTVSFKYNESRQLASIAGSRKRNVSFKYSKNHNLIAVRNMWANVYTYSYDTENRLTRLTYPDKTFETVGYDAKSNNVVKSTDRYTCQSTFSRKVNPNSPKLNVTVASDCTNKPKTYSFSKSILFPKNRKNISELNVALQNHDPKRSPSSLPRRASIKPVQELSDANFLYKFGVNQAGQPISLIATDKKSNQKMSLQFTYEKGQLKSLSSPAHGSIHYIYNENAMMVKTILKPTQANSEFRIIEMYEKFMSQFLKKKAATW